MKAQHKSIIFKLSLKYFYVKPPVLKSNSSTGTKCHTLRLFVLGFFVVFVYVSLYQWRFLLCYL